MCDLNCDWIMGLHVCINTFLDLVSRHVFAGNIRKSLQCTNSHTHEHSSTFSQAVTVSAQDDSLSASIHMLRMQVLSEIAGRFLPSAMADRLLPSAIADRLLPPASADRMLKQIGNDPLSKKTEKNTFGIACTRSNLG